MLKDSLRISRDLGELLTIAVDLGRFASVLAAEGKAAMAARLLSSSEALTEERGASVVWWAGRRNEETLATIRTHLGAPLSRHDRHFGCVLDQPGRLG